MATVRKYKQNEDPENGEWVSFASSDAAQIYSKNPLLTESPEEADISVEQAIINNKRDIQVLKKNVSWLARHGGGGYGGGSGGGTASSATVVIFGQDNEEGITQLIWTNSITQIRYKVSSRGTSKYNITVKANGNTVYTEANIPKNTVRSFPASLLKVKSSNVRMQIYAVDENANEYLAECMIVVSTIKLSAESSLLEATKAELGLSSFKVRLRASVTIPGEYRLYYSRSQIVYRIKDGIGNFYESGDESETLESKNQYLILNDLTSIESTVSVSIKEPNGEGSSPILDQNSVEAGKTYPIQFRLVYASNPSLFSDSVSVAIVVKQTTGLTIIPLLGQDEFHRFPIASGGSLPLRFRVISPSNQGSYMYSVAWEDDPNNIITSGEYVPFGIEQVASINLLGVDEGERTLIIKAWVVGGSSITSAPVYIYIQAPLAARAEAYLNDLSNSIIFDYTVDSENFDKDPFNGRDSRFTVSNQVNYKGGGLDEFVQIKNSLEIINKGIDSVYSGYNFSLNHRAFGIISTESAVSTSKSYIRWFPQKGEDTQSLITPNNYNSPEGFTFDIAYSVDSIDDDCTIFNFGNIDTQTETGSGILIKAHKYYIRIRDILVKGDLEDSTFTHLLVKFGQDENGVIKITVFKNGVFHQVADAPYKNAVGNSINFDLGYLDQKMYLAGRLQNVNDITNVKEFTNVKIYSVRLIAKQLNIGQIICSYINNYACYYDLIGEYHSEKNPVVVTKLLTINNIRSDSEALRLTQSRDDPTATTANTYYISDFFNFQNGKYTWNLENSWPDNTLDIGLPLNEALLQDISIPIVVLRTNWTYSSFKSTSSLPSQDINCRFAYRDAGSDSYVRLGNLETQPITLSIQGTTTMGYELKNLDIEFTGNNENITFSPKDTWFPEKYFTLKADIVDSGHINNAVIGKFVNDCYNSGKNLINTAAFPMKSAIDNNSNFTGSNFTPKTNIEGFPVLLIMNFAGDGNNPRESRIIGIYSFNLGRRSTYNLGFEIPTKLNDVTNNEVSIKDAVFPGYYGKCSTSNNYAALCFEGDRSLNSSIVNVNFDSNDYHFVEIQGRLWYPNNNNLRNDGGYVKYGSDLIKDDNGQNIPWDSTNVVKKKVLPCGYFWSDHESYRNNTLWSKYFDGTNNKTGEQEFRKLNQFIVSSMEYSKGSVSFLYNSPYAEYEITSISASENPNEEPSISISPTGNTITPQYAQQQEDIPLSIQNTAFYYVVCLLFGLVDSFGKNLQFKAWVPPDTSAHYYWSPSFYDMDTALGLDNIGLETISPTHLDYSITNDPDHRYLPLFGKAPQSTNGVYTVFSNKLWGAIESEQFVDHYLTDYGNYTGYRFYSDMWHRLRSGVIPDVNKFVDDYFYTQLEDCGQLIINYDYTVKYLGTEQQSMLHGTRLDFIRNWLKKRVSFLDSIFGYGIDNTSYLVAAGLNTYEIPYLNKITLHHDSGSLTTPLTTSSSVLVRTKIGQKSTTYTYVPEGISTEVIVSDTLNTPNIQTEINNSSLIKNIPDLRSTRFTGITVNSVLPVQNTEGNPIYSTGISEIYYQYGTLSGLRVFDLSGIQTIGSEINLFNLFKTWDNSGWGGVPNEYRLEKLNYSNTKYIGSSGSLRVDLSGTSATGSNIPEIYKSPFKNITEIDVSNSNVNSIIIPDGVSLASLNIKNSLIGSLSLIGQPILSNIDFTGCSQLKALTLNNCDKFTSLYLGPSVSSLEKLTVTNCKNLETITLDGSVLAKLPKIIIEGCSSLYSIQLTGCRGNGNEDTPSSPYTDASLDPRIVQIRTCENLQIITLDNSDFKALYIDEDSQVKLSSISASNSKLMHLETTADATSLPEGENNYIIDLTNINQEKQNEGSDVEVPITLNLSNNISVKKIRFANIESKPFVLKNNGVFSGCTSLERVFGNLIIEGSSTFSKCTSLRLFPDNFNGISYKNNNRWLHPTEIISGGSSLIVSYSGGRRVKWIGGENSLNFILRRNSEQSSSSDTCGSKSLFAGEETGIKGPNLNNFEIYYSLFNIYHGDTNALRPKTISAMFYCLSTSGGIKRDFNWGSVDNSPHREMYSNCIYITNADSIYYGTSLVASGGSYRALSPQKSNGVFQDNGLLSPLKNCTSLYSILPNTWYCDNNLFRLGNGSFVCAGLHSICPAFVCSKPNPSNPDERGIEFISRDEMNLLISKNEGSSGYDNEDPISLPPVVGDFELYEIGNLTNFFKDCTNLATLTNVLNNTGTLIIDFRRFSSGNNIGFSKMTTINTSFLCRSGIGELSLDNLFVDDTAKAKLTTIRNSFRFGKKIRTISSGVENIEEFKFVLNFNTFLNFPNLVSLVALDLENNYSPDYCPFRGSGLTKIIEVQNPQPNADHEDEGKFSDILHHGKWTSLDGLFCEAEARTINDSVFEGIMLIPSTLFAEDPNTTDENRRYNALTSFRAGFYNLKTRFRLTGGGFETCSALSNVSHLFGRSSINLETNNSNIDMIPLKLFYQGYQDDSVELKGSFHTETIPVDNIVTRTIGGVPTNVATKTIDGVIYNYYKYEATDENLVIKISPVTVRYYVDSETSTTVTKQMGKIWAEENSNFIKVFYNNDSDQKYHFKKYTSTIANMTGCFTKLNINTFSSMGDSDTPYTLYNEYNKEDCKDFSPFPYIFQNNNWEENPVQNFNRYTFMWAYDGNPQGYYNHVINSTTHQNLLTAEESRFSAEIPELSGKLTFEMLDEIKSTNGINQISISSGESVRTVHSDKRFLGGSPDDSSPNFCLPPDLFRYSKNDVIITSIFQGCGIPYINIGEINAQHDNTLVLLASTGYGLQGRLCPYLLKPIQNANRLSDAFNECRYLGYYEETNSGGKAYVIPKTFFSGLLPTSFYMQRMFKCTNYPRNIDLDVFKFANNRSKTMYIDYMFENISISGNGSEKALISNVFNKSYMVFGPDFKGVFANTKGSTHSMNKQPVKFEQVFNSTAHNKGTQIFYGYHSDYVEHEPSGQRTVSSAESAKNYYTVD